MGNSDKGIKLWGRQIDEASHLLQAFSAIIPFIKFLIGWLTVVLAAVG